MEDRVLLLALRGRDASIVAGLLERQGQTTAVCSSSDDLAAALAQGAGTALITEESLTGVDSTALGTWLAHQEAWSDFPFILLATKRTGSRPRDAVRLLATLGNVVVLERPIHSETLASAVSSALRVRRRQYDARARLAELQRAEERLIQLNASLEARIAERTSELSQANNQLMQEVAERERAQAALVQSQKVDAIGQLTGGIAHDFNNLLTVIAGNLELIERRGGGDRRTVLYAGNAQQAAARAAKLTHQLLAFSRTQQLTLEPVDLNALVAGMWDLLDRTIGPHVRKQRRLADATLWVMGDANQVELAILNLAINARDAMADGGVLTIATDLVSERGGDIADGTYGVVTVTDTGTGIPPKLLHRVIDPFFTTKPLGKGTGLGLSQVFGIARQSGGTARVHSVEGEGTSVSIWLPVSAPPAARAVVAPALPDSVRADGRVLIIDDDDGVRQFMAESLAMLGYSVAEAAGGAEGLDRLTAERPDALIVDFAMDGLNGAEVAARARAIAPDMPIILVTGYADVDDFGDTVDAVLRKPFKIDDLAAALDRALA